MDALNGVGEKRKADAFERDACARVERLVTEGRAGRAPRAEDLSPEEWELYLVWLRREAEHEAAERQSLHELSANFALLLEVLKSK